MLASFRYALLVLALIMPTSLGFTITITSSNLRTSPPLQMSTIDEPQLKQQCTLDGRKIRGPITPLGNFVLVRTKETLDATEGGILLPDQVSFGTSNILGTMVTFTNDV